MVNIQSVHKISLIYFSVLKYHWSLLNFYVFHNNIRRNRRSVPFYELAPRVYIILTRSNIQHIVCRQYKKENNESDRRLLYLRCSKVSFRNFLYLLSDDMEPITYVRMQVAMFVFDTELLFTPTCHLTMLLMFFSWVW